jgi:hypothetical protein
MHLVTVKEKLIARSCCKIVIMIKGYSSLVEFLVLSQILNIKLPCFVVLSRKEVKKIHLKCAGVNRGLLILCTDSTDFLLESVSVVAVNCDPLGSLAPPTILD